MGQLKSCFHSCVDFTVFSLGFAILLTMLVIMAPDTFASKPLTGGISASQMIQKMATPTVAPVQPVTHGYVGIDLTIRPNTPPVINTVFSGSPAAKSGLRSGDVLLTADNVPLAGLAKQAVDDAISDVVGHVIRFQVQRASRVVPVSVKVVAPSTKSTSFADIEEDYLSCLIP